MLVTTELVIWHYANAFISTNQSEIDFRIALVEGREKVEDEPRAGRPSTSKTDDNVERVRSVVRSDRRLTLRMISSELN
jgi:hypothetical protein